MAVRTKLTVAYLGDGFSGWQRQDNARTVQGELEQSFARVTGSDRVVVVGAGRTDAGVHARGQVAHVDLPAAIPTDVVPRILNGSLPSKIRVRRAVTVAECFHARKSALGKHYAYRVGWHPPKLPWLGLRTAVAPAPTDVGAFERSCRRLPGRRDWASFTVPEVAGRPTVRTVFNLDLHWRRDGVEFHFFGEGFLRYQVRRMVGALLEVGHGRMSEAEFRELLERPRPGAPLPTAPATGLTLERVYYRRSPKLGSATANEPPGNA